MSKYHIRPKSGEPGYCKAETKCPYAGPEEHYETKEAARAAYEASMSEEVNPLAREKPAEIIYSEVDPNASREELEYLGNGWELDYIEPEQSIYAEVNQETKTAELVLFDEDGNPKLQAVVDTDELRKALKAFAFVGYLRGRNPEVEPEALEKVYQSFLQAGGRTEEDAEAVSVLISVKQRTGETKEFFSPEKLSRKHTPRTAEERFSPRTVRVARKVAKSLDR